ncbi:MAG: hypothetical protein AB1531_11125 [Chloroflexota bacterium]
MFPLQMSTTTATTETENSTASSGLGVTRANLQAVFESQGVVFEAPETENDETSVQGMYYDNERGQEIGVLVILYGPEDDLTSAAINVLIPFAAPANAYQTVSEKLNIMLSLVAPEWDEGRSWVDANINAATESTITYNHWNDLIIQFMFQIYTEDFGGLSYYLLLFKDPENNYPISVITPMPVPTITRGWGLYRDPFMSFQHPSTWVEQDVTQDFACQDIGAGCLVNLEISGKGMVSISRMVLDDQPDIETLDEDLWALRVEFYSNQGLEDRLVLESRRVYVIDGQTAVERIFTEPNILVPDQNSDIDAYIIEVLFKQGVFTYTIILTSFEKDLRDESAPDFEAMLLSIDLYP